MEYQLSQKNDNEKKKYEEMIKQNDKEYLKISEEIRKIRTSKEGTMEDRYLTRLELEIRQEEISQDTEVKKQAIEKLYVRQIKENLEQRIKNRKISVSEFSNEHRNAEEYDSIKSTKDDIEYFDNENSILEMKIKLESMKRNMGKVPKEQADKNIAEMQQTLLDNKKHGKEALLEDLAEQNFKYKRRNLAYQRKIGEITSEEFKQKLEELEQTKSEIPDEKQLTEMRDRLTDKYLEESQSSQEFNHENSDRKGLYGWYQLSQKNDNEKKKYEEMIKQNDKEYLKISEEIIKIRTSKEGTIEDRYLARLELEIRQEEINQDIEVKKQAIEKLYVRQMKENLIQRRKNGEISASEFANEHRNAKEYDSIKSTKDDIEHFDNEKSILEMKIKLESMKRNMGKVPKEQADKNIAEMQQTLSDNEKYGKETLLEDLAEQNFKYKGRNLAYQRKIGEITSEEFKQKLEELEQTKSEIPDEKQLTEMRDRLTGKYLEKFIHIEGHGDMDVATYIIWNVKRVCKSAGINQEDLNKAYETIRRTKAEREQTQYKKETNKFEGRG